MSLLNKVDIEAVDIVQLFGNISNAAGREKIIHRHKHQYKKVSIKLHSCKSRTEN